MFGAEFTSGKPLKRASLEVREAKVEERIKFYQTISAAEGAVTGAGGILRGLADFPLLLVFKTQITFEIAILCGRHVYDYKERVYILYIFQLAFSSHVHRKSIYFKMTNWEEQTKQLPGIHSFDWRTLQQERDYVDRKNGSICSCGWCSCWRCRKLSANKKIGQNCYEYLPDALV